MGTKRVFDHILDGRDFAKLYDDFQEWTAANYTITETGVATQAITPGNGGLALITNAAADDDASFQQTGEIFKYAVGKAFAFRCRFKVSDATQSDFVFGLQITDTAPLDVTDGIFFQKDDGDALLDFHVEKDGVASDETGIHTMVADTFVTLEFYYDGDGNDIQVFVDGSRVAGVALTNVPDDEDLAISFGIQNGEAVAKTMTIDFWELFTER